MKGNFFTQNMLKNVKVIKFKYKKNPGSVVSLLDAIHRKFLLKSLCYKKTRTQMHLKDAHMYMKINFSLA